MTCRNVTKGARSVFAICSGVQYGQAEKAVENRTCSLVSRFYGQPCEEHPHLELAGRNIQERDLVPKILVSRVEWSTQNGLFRN